MDIFRLNYIVNKKSKRETKHFTDLSNARGLQKDLYYLMCIFTYLRHI